MKGLTPACLLVSVFTSCAVTFLCVGVFLKTSYTPKFTWVIEARSKKEEIILVSRNPSSMGWHQRERESILSLFSCSQGWTRTRTILTQTIESSMGLKGVESSMELKKAMKNGKGFHSCHDSPHPSLSLSLCLSLSLSLSLSLILSQHIQICIFIRAYSLLCSS